MLLFPGLKWSFPEISMENNSETVCVHENIPPAHRRFFFLFFSLGFFYRFFQLKTSIILEICPEHLERHREFRASREFRILSPFILFFIKFSLLKCSFSVGYCPTIYTLYIEIFLVSYFDNWCLCKASSFRIKASKDIFSTFFSY